MGSGWELTLLSGATGSMRPAPHGSFLGFSLSSVPGASIKGGGGMTKAGFPPASFRRSSMNDRYCFYYRVCADGGAIGTARDRDGFVVLNDVSIYYF